MSLMEHGKCVAMRHQNKLDNVSALHQRRREGEGVRV